LTHTLTVGALTLKNNLLLAPMAGITNLPMRLLARECGASLAFTEMVSVAGLVREGRKTFDLVRSSPADRPLGIQIFGEDPAMLAEGARLVEPRGDLIDINMGCPVRKVVGSGAGSALMRDPARVASIVREVRRATSLPLTVKIRTGWTADEDTCEEVARIAEAEGCDAVTLHPRSRAQMFEGKADWSRIARLKEILRIPVLGSGDLFRATDVMEMLSSTGCDGVMIARGGLGNPWIFRESQDLLAGRTETPPTLVERHRTALRHLDLFVELVGERVAAREMRKHFCWYAHGVPGAAHFRALVNGLSTRDEMAGALAAFFGLNQP